MGRGALVGEDLLEGAVGRNRGREDEGSSQSAEEGRPAGVVRPRQQEAILAYSRRCSSAILSQE